MVGRGLVWEDAVSHIGLPGMGVRVVGRVILETAAGCSLECIIECLLADFGEGGAVLKEMGVFSVGFSTQVTASVGNNAFAVSAVRGLDLACASEDLSANSKL
jgi:hypothetical protein